MPRQSKETKDTREAPREREQERTVFEQKNRLLEQIKNLDESGQMVAVMRIMQHSIEDGFEFARMLGLDARAKAAVFLQPEVYFKHHELLDEVYKTLFENRKVLSEKLEGEEVLTHSAIIGSVTHFQSIGGSSSFRKLGLPLSLIAARDSRSRQDLLSELWWSDEKWKKLPPQEIVDAIDSYYAPFLAQRELAPLPQEKHDVVREQEEYLDLVDDVAHGLYYTGPAQRMLLSRVSQQNPELVQEYYRAHVEKEEGAPTAEEFAALCGRGDSRQALDFLESLMEWHGIPEDVWLRLRHSSVIPAELLAPILSAFGIDAQSGDAARVLARAQYKMADVLFTSQKSHGVRSLDAELEQSLSLRGVDMGKVTFALDEQSGAYRAMYDGKPMEGPEKGEGEKGKAEEAEAELPMKPWIVPRQDIEQVLQRYKRIESAQRVGREYSFHVHDQNNRSFVVAENGQVGRRYLGIHNLTAVGDELYFAAVGGGKSFIVSPDGKEGKRYDRIGSLISVGDSLYYSAEEDGQSFIVSPDGKEGKRYEGIGDLASVGDSLYYSARESVEFFIVSPDGKEGKRYDNIGSPISVGDSLYYSARDGRQSFIVSPDGKEGKRYDAIIFLTAVGDSLYYLAQEEVEFFIVSPDGKEGKRYDNTGSLISVGDSLYYSAEEGGQWFIFASDGERQTGPFSSLTKIYADAERSLWEGTSADGKREFFEFVGPKKEERPVFTAREQRLLDLSSLIQTLPTRVGEEYLERLQRYNTQYRTEPRISWKERMQEAVSRSGGAARAFTDMLKQAPRLLLDMLPAKRDRVDAAHVRRILFELLPSLARQEQAAGARIGGAGERAEEIARAFDPANFLMDAPEGRLADGDPAMENAPELFSTREEIPFLLITKIYGGYDRETGIWRRLLAPIAPELGEPVREYTITIPKTHGLSRLRLPVAEGATVEPSRLKGIGKDGKEIDLPREAVLRALVHEPSGGATFDISALPKRLQKELAGIVYSQRRSALPMPMEPVRQKEYDYWLRAFEKRQGTALSDSLGQLPEEISAELAPRLEGIEPKEKVIAIQKLVQEICAYDMENREVMGDKWGMTVSDKVDFMRHRMDELRVRDPEKYAKKYYAGVCADTAELAAALLREAGFAAGVMTGFRAHGGPVRVSDAHACAYVLWPEQKTGKTRLVVVDATPSSADPEEQRLLDSVRAESIQEAEELGRAEERKLRQELAAALEKATQELHALDASAIRDMRNGALERLLNAVLAVVPKEQVDAIHAIFTVGRYSRTKMHEADFTDPIVKANFLGDLRALLEGGQEEKPPALRLGSEGERLVSDVSFFADRVTKDAKTPEKARAFDTLQSILQLVHDARVIDELTYKSGLVTIEYLRAEAMTGEKK